MNYETKQQLIKRLKSLMWRLGSVLLVFTLTAFTDEIMPILGMSAELKMFIGLVLGEITKYLNTK